MAHPRLAPSPRLSLCVRNRVIIFPQQQTCCAPADRQGGLLSVNLSSTHSAWFAQKVNPQTSFEASRLERREVEQVEQVED